MHSWMSAWYKGDVLSYRHSLKDKKLLLQYIVYYKYGILYSVEMLHVFNSLPYTKKCSNLKLCICSKRDLEGQVKDLVLKLKAMKVTISPYLVAEH